MAALEMPVAKTPLAGERGARSSIIEAETSVTDVVLAAMEGAENPRLREIMAALVRHLHAFAREVRLTEEELDLGIDFLNRIGQATNDTHNEGLTLTHILLGELNVIGWNLSSRFWRAPHPSKA
jgi:hypothetical protein